MSLITFHHVHLTLAQHQILDNVDWQIQPRDRLALVGRNGAGKSTLLKLLQGLLVQDRGEIHYQQGLRIAGLAQDVPFDESKTVFASLVDDLDVLGPVLIALRQHTQIEDFNQIALCQQKIDDLHAWDILPKIESIASHLSLPLDEKMSALSGGMKRRVLLAAAIITEPDLLLLDEPTNHLDLSSIEWLESYLTNYPGAVVLVTHDRTFLSKIAEKIVDLDRGKIRVYHCSYEDFLDRREAFRIAEQTQVDLFDKRLADEERWIRTGIKARRTRNEGRVRALKAMREAYQQRRKAPGVIKGHQWEVQRSGSLVLEAQRLNYHPLRHPEPPLRHPERSEGSPKQDSVPQSKRSLATLGMTEVKTLEMTGEQPLIRDFSLVLHRGEKLGIMGPNGCGKTTLVRLLLGELQPDTGDLRMGTSLVVAYFDQLRRQLDMTQTVMANVADGADHVMIQGKSKHVASYLQDFLFTPASLNQPVSSLSGGERNRLLLAKLLAKPANLLVLDEPTNDLDIETLELLESLLVDYPGTLILISHDRAFINEVVTSILVYEEDHCFHEYLGGYDTYQNIKKNQPLPKITTAPSQKETRTQQAKRTLNYTEQRELAKLPQQIEKLEQTIQNLQKEYADPTFYQRSSAEITLFQQQLAQKEAELAKLYTRWETLEEG